MLLGLHLLLLLLLLLYLLLRLLLHGLCLLLLLGNLRRRSIPSLSPPCFLPLPVPLLPQFMLLLLLLRLLLHLRLHLLLLRLHLLLLLPTVRRSRSARRQPWTSGALAAPVLRLLLPSLPRLALFAHQLYEGQPNNHRRHRHLHHARPRYRTPPFLDTLRRVPDARVMGPHDRGTPLGWILPRVCVSPIVV